MSDIYTKYGILLGTIVEMNKIIEGERGNTPSGRYRKIKKLILEPRVQNLIKQDYESILSSNPSVKWDER